jgi:plasmid replication initiation protein
MGNLVVKDNALIEASHRLSEVEQRLILLAVLKAREYCDSVEQLQGKELIIYADDYMQTFGVTRQVAYRMLKQAVMGLYRAEWGYRYINSKGNKVVAYERFTQSAKYVEAEATVKFMFANAIIPFLVELEKRFTTYEIEQVAQLSSQYAMRLYEFFMQNLDKKSGKGWLDISLDELRFRFGLLPTEYNRMGDFKKGVLDLAMSQINEKTDLTATYEQRKKGRTIVGFKFEFSRKISTKPKKIKDNTERDPKTIDIFDNLTDKEREIIAQKNAYADQKGITDPLHRQNLIKKALEQHRQAEQSEQERKQREKAERQTKKQQEKEQLELGQRQFEQILASDGLINAYIANNIVAKYLSGLQKIRYEQGDFRGVFEMERYKFEQLHELQRLNLKFLD